jgi:hypothetical protein
MMFDKVGLPDHSPHKFRHGHAGYAIKNAKDIPALKAVSQNLMHANLSITDGVYGILSETDVREQISTLGKMADFEYKHNFEELLFITKQLLEKLNKD